LHCAHFLCSFLLLRFKLRVHGTHLLGVTRHPFTLYLVLGFETPRPEARHQLALVDHAQNAIHRPPSPLRILHLSAPAIPAGMELSTNHPSDHPCHGASRSLLLDGLLSLLLPLHLCRSLSYLLMIGLLASFETPCPEARRQPAILNHAQNAIHRPPSPLRILHLSAPAIPAGMELSVEHAHDHAANKSCPRFPLLRFKLRVHGTHLLGVTRHPFTLHLVLGFETPRPEARHQLALVDHAQNAIHRPPSPLHILHLSAPAIPAGMELGVENSPHSTAHETCCSLLPLSAVLCRYLAHFLLV
jgi:hypothetical protein